MNPDRYRGLRGGSVALPTLFGTRRYVFAAGALAGALLACAPARAQSDVRIEDRIEATFDLVLGNSAELAVPLTRRALARRSVERNGGLALLPYTGAEPEAADSNLQQSEEDQVGAVEQGSAEDDAELARLPRPRPVVISEATGTRDLIGQPLDLVAGAAVGAPLEQDTAAAAPPGDSVVVVAAAPAGDVPTALIPPAAPASEPTELVAAESCLTVADVTDKDGDFKRNAEALSSGSSLCIAEEGFKERRRPWVIQTVTSRRPGPLWAVMHDDEDLSFDNAVEAVKKYGGTVVAVETGGKRNLSGIDPNRNFSADGVGCRKLGDNAAPRFTDFFRELIDPTQPIVALHNNSKDRIPSGGLGHISMDLVPKSMRASPASDPDGSLAGTHALVLLAAAALDDPTAEGRTAILNKEGINVVLERVQKDHGDCSLSNFAVLIDNPNYFNVTVHEDEGEKQLRIIDVLMKDRSETVASQ
jgi:hypothetical protein